MVTEDTRIPVTLLTGFLGAGKTTVLNHLIRDPAAGQIAVIMNEFGSVGLDHDLIEEATEETILMQSGCLCCTFRGDIAKTLGALMAKKKRGDLSFDRVVIETTGIADPAPILHTLVVDDLISHYYRMDGVVTLADAASGHQTLEAHAEATQQIAVADLVILTKTDLVSPIDVTRFEKRVTQINDTAQRMRANHGRVPPGALFGLSALHMNASAQDLARWLGALHGSSDLEGKASEHDTTHLATAPKANHKHHISSASIEVHDPIPASVFDFWIDMLMALKGPDILRIKGIVHVEDMQFPIVFHGVQHIFDPPVHLETWRGADKRSRVVVIARNVTKEELDTSLKRLLMKTEEEEKTAQGMTHQTYEMPF